MQSQEEINEYVLNLFKENTKNNSITLDTPCKDVFYLDIHLTDLLIGKPIEEKFGLTALNVGYGLAEHRFNNLGYQEKSFYKKWPKKNLGTKKDTLGTLSEMVFDLIKIKSNTKIN